jgi:hypothetical protein
MHWLIALIASGLAASPQAYTIYQHSDLGNAKVETRIVAQRGDGSHVAVKHLAGPGYDDRLLILVAAGTQARVLDEVKAVSTQRIDMAIYSKTQGGIWDPASGCTKPLAGTAEGGGTILEKDTIAGIAVNKVQMQPGFFVWLAPALNCQEMKSQLTGGFTLTTSSVVWGEPDASLFAVPAGYAEMLPSAALRLRLVRMGKAPADKVEQLVANYFPT